MFAEFIWTYFAAGLLIAVVLLAVILFLRLQNKKLGQKTDLLAGSLNTLGYGLIFFDCNDRFFLANRPARKYLPFLDENGNSERKDLSGFLDYLFDHAVECDESLKNTLSKSAEFMSSQGFREVICWAEEKYCLVEALRTDNGRTVLTLTDVSNIKKHEEDFIRLNDHNHELTEAVEAATIGIVITNPNIPGHPVIFVNKAFCALADMPAREVVGQNIQTLLHKIAAAEERQSIYEALDENRPLEQEIKLAAPDEESLPRWFDLRLTPVENPRGGVGLFIAVFTDITELRLREAELSQAQKLEALGQLAAGVAHDFNNVLSIIDGYSRLAENIVTEDETATDYLTKVRAAARRGADLTKKMLTFSRHKIVVKTSLDLVELVRDQEALLCPLLDATINFKINAPAEPVYVECTEDTISQILMNLVINARDAMPGGGDLTVDVKHSRAEDILLSMSQKLPWDECAVLRVSDTGIGMDSKTQKRIFDPFFTTKEQGKGTGLGLSMVYGLVQQMGGIIDVTSVEGQSTTFSICMPLSASASARQVIREGTDIESVDLTGYTALVAEDEPDLLALVSDMLEKLGMKTIQASNGNEALVKQNDYEDHIDLLLTDVVMPEMDGVKLAELFASERPDTRTIFMSGYPAHGQIARIELPEKACFLAKPIQYESLVRLIVEELSGQNGKVSPIPEEMETARWTTEKTADG